MKKVLLVSIAFVNILNASNLTHTLSNQGYTGLINTPNAQVMNEGDLTLQYNNQFDNVLRGYNYNKGSSSQEDYIFGAGLFPYFEVQGRLSEAPGYHRDLSANVKVQLPYKNMYLPNLAIGVQDLGSAANQYGNKYIVIDKELWFLRASLGYGKSDASSENEKRMDGIFGGLEVQTFDWLYLIAEDDSKEQFAAIRLETPASWSDSLKLNTLVSTNLTDDYKTSVTFNLTFSLYENTKAYKSLDKNKKQLEKPHKKHTYQLIDNYEDLAKLQNNFPLLKAEKKKVKVEQYKSIEDIKAELINLGIENITIATKEDEIYVAYENSVFLFNDLDAMGIVIGALQQTKYTRFKLEQKRSQVPIITLSGNLDKARKFYANPSLANKKLFTNSLEKIEPTDMDPYTLLVKNDNDSLFKPRMEFKPLVKTFVGNEFGLFTYKLWLRTQLQMTLYEGVDLTAVGDLHIYDNKPENEKYNWFLRLYEKGSYLNSVMLNYSANVFGGINTLSLGTLEEDYMGVMNQYIYNYANHTFKLKLGYFEEFQDGDAYVEKYLGKYDTRELFLAQYSYMLADYDTLAEITVGQYWNKDIGGDVKIKRFFGDVAVYLEYEQSTPYKNGTMFDESTNHYAGLGIEIPLTLRDTPSYKYGQVKGTNAFDYRVKTTIQREDGTNNIVPSGNYNPEMAISSENYFYNRNRLQLSYIKTHSFRLVKSFEKYVE